MKIKFAIFTLFVALISISAYGQTSKEKIDQWLVDGYYNFRQDTSLSGLINFYAEKQLGIPYQAHMLDEPDTESLQVRTDSSDCVIYVETTVALAMTTMQHDSTFNRFKKNLQLIRYRNGKIDGYFSRLHYFTDWLLNNQKKGIITLISQHWPGAVKMDSVYFMSHHLAEYPKLAHSDSLTALIKAKEKQLSASDIAYVPKKMLPMYIDRIHTGDIIAFVTTIKGLDISHTALAYRDGDFITFMHASTKRGVIIEPLGLLTYIYSRNNLKGIIIARLKANAFLTQSSHQKGHRTDESSPSSPGVY